jgi:hypothetical protein
LDALYPLVDDIVPKGKVIYATAANHLPNLNQSIRCSGGACVEIASETSCSLNKEGSD